MTTPALIISENNGLQRAIALRGRSLPFKGAVLVEDEQRMEITFFPGNPVAYSQILGPQLTKTTFTGTWQDKYLSSEENAPAATNFPEVTAAGRPPLPGELIITGQTFVSSGAFPGTQQLRLSKTVRDAFRLLTRSGAHIRASWDDWSRFGHISRFMARPDAPDEWHWELEFSWTGDTDVQPVAFEPDLNVKSFIDTLNGLADGLATLLQLPGLTVNRTFGPIASDLGVLGVQLRRLIKTLSGFVDFTYIPLQQMSALKAQAFAIRQDILNIYAKMQAQDGRIAGSGRRSTADAWQSDLLIRKVRQIMNLMAQEVAVRLAEIEGATAGRVDRIYQVESVTSLQRVSTEIYGNPNNWRQIARFNNITSQIVESGTVLRIPKLGG